MFNFKSIKAQLIIFLSVFAIFLAFKEQDTRFLSAIFIAVFSSVIIETAIKYFISKTIQVTESSVVTGLIVGFVLSSEEAWWMIALTSIFAILSKYLVRWRKKHIFNPAGFGIFLSLALGAFSQWKGTYLWYILLPFGAYFSFKIRKLEVVFGYACVTLLLFGIQAALQHLPLVNIFGYLSYFFIFIMLVEPLTTPVKPVGKYIFGACAAALIFVLTESGVKFDAELCSLLVMNAFVPLLNKLTFKKEGSI